MRSPHSSARVWACFAVVLLLGGASLPRAMAGPGEWEVGKSASAQGTRVCLPDPAMLMQWEHRGKPCTRTILNSTIDRAEVQYQCASGGFGTSRVQVITPRSVKIITQGISDGLPFGYTVHARRVGDCRPEKRPQSSDVIKALFNHVRLGMVRALGEGTLSSLKGAPAPELGPLRRPLLFGARSD